MVEDQMELFYTPRLLDEIQSAQELLGDRE
jgi:hypothetical protein